jgi:2-polyprenyl-3-methyl-5-hydroxy-6-metoxy-1,4-benzoquinol methylase
LRNLREKVAPTVEVIRDLEGLDRKIHELDIAAMTSDDALREKFATFRMEPSFDVPSDPYSDEYREQQLALYKRIAGKDYSPSNEVTKFPVEIVLDSPFPFATQSCQTVGNHLMGIGFLIKSMALKPNAKILEFGPGWGNTTEYLARMGFQVTAVDIEKDFVELIRKRAQRANLYINTICADFSYIEMIEEKFDAVLFFECFHHASDHMRILRSLQRVIKDDGIAVFGAEPIFDAFPLPWGLRLDGESLWAIRKHGWLELGFQEKYFSNTLRQLGWAVSKHECHDTPWGTVFVARRA